MEKLQQTKLLTVLVLGAVFGTGVVVGMTVDRIDVEPESAGEVSEPAEEAEAGDRGQDQGRRDRGRRPIWTLVDGLTDEQRARMDSISDGIDSSLDVIRREMAPAFDQWERDFEPLDQRRDSLRDDYNRQWRATIDQAVEEIKALMTTAQAAEYDSLLTESRERGQRGRRRRGGSPRD